MNPREALLRLVHDIEHHLIERGYRGARLDLYALGGSALIIHWGKAGATKDLDILRESFTACDDDDAVLDDLITNFGKGSERSPYLDPVPGGLPPLAAGWRLRAIPVESTTGLIRLWVLSYWPRQNPRSGLHHPWSPQRHPR